MDKTPIAVQKKYKKKITKLSVIVYVLLALAILVLALHFAGVLASLLEMDNSTSLIIAVVLAVLLALVSALLLVKISKRQKAYEAVQEDYENGRIPSDDIALDYEVQKWGNEFYTLPPVVSVKKSKEFFRVIKYFCIAASAGVIQFGTYALFNEVFKWNYWLSYIISLVLSVIWNFTFNRKYTFKSANNVPIAMLKVFAYYCVFTPCSTLWTNAITTTFVFDDPAQTALVVYGTEIGTLLINGITEFLYQRFFVFGKTIDQTEVPEGAQGKIFVPLPKYSGDDMLELMKEGKDINAMKPEDFKKSLGK